jgi:hypothetical protein
MLRLERVVLLTLVVLLVAPVAARADSDFLPAGMLLNCTMDEPNFSSKTAEVGDPVLCHLGTTSALGRQLFPRGTYLSGLLQDYKAPGHFAGKGWISIQFDRLILPGEAVLPLSAKVISVPHYKVARDGRVMGKGHAKRDAVEWAIPVLWPVKLLALPGRGPFPTLKGETRITLRLMEDVAIPTVARAYNVPMPPWARPTNWSSPSGALAGNGDSRLMNAAIRQVPKPAATRIDDVATSAEDQRPTLLLLKDGSVYLVQEYWLENDAIHGVLENGKSKMLPIADLDLAGTVRLNRERRVAFTLEAKSR